ncbi:MAG: ATPase, T2SS/T4P/T4SS family [archaeon]
MVNPTETFKGNVIDSYGDIVVRERYPCFLYEVKPIRLLEEEKELAEILRSVITRKITSSEITPSFKKKIPKEFLSGFNETIVHTIEMSGCIHTIPDAEILSALKMNLMALVKEHLSFAMHERDFVDSVLDYSIGYGYLAPLMRDDWLEEIMVNGYNQPAFVFHKKYGMCETNLLVLKDGFIHRLIDRIARTVNREINDSAPLLDARLPDGSRANATSAYATPFGPSLTIRKFTRIPLSIIDLIINNTLTSEVGAFLWAMVEGLGIEPMNILVTGGSGTGKTTTLNALTSFVYFNQRIITIEDTPELHLGNRKNWIQMEAKPSLPKTPEITMDQLLQNALRMRPDRIIVGEVRGDEAQTLFTAMDIGHKGIMGTLHSNSGREMITRLKSQPMNVPEVMIPLLDLLVVQYRMYLKDKGIIRRIAQITEISRMEDTVLLGEVYTWRREEDTLRKTDVPSHIIEKLAQETGKTKREVFKEIEIRERILEWMVRKRIRSNPEVEKVIQEYYYNPTSVLERVSEEL